jgi:hypothetical protein
MHRARAALRNTAAVFGSGEPDLFANNPQEWRLGLYVDLVDFTVDVQRYHSFAFLMTTKCSSLDNSLSSRSLE